MVVLAHNHPSGDITPSDQDVSTTLYIRRLMDQIHIYVYDHVILSDEEMTSMRACGYFIPIH